MKRRLARWALAIGLLGFVSPAWAELELCNDTEVSQQVAVGYIQDGDWVSEGWWQLQPDSCIAAVLGALESRVYYFRAQSDGWVFRHDRVSFCTREGVFTISGNSNCASRGYQASYFAKIVTDRNATHFSQRLSQRSTRGRGREQMPIEAEAQPGVWGLPYRGAVIFQGCSPLSQASNPYCIFIGNGRKFTVSGDVRTPSALFESLRQIDVGTPVFIQGDWVGRFSSSVELVLRDVQLRSASDEDRLLSRLQGSWYSVSDPGDQFTVKGSGRQNRYNSTLTSMEYLSVMPYCGEFDTEGPYLFAWDSQGGTGLCYVIREVSDIELVLTYLPRGTELRYRRLE